MIPDIERDQREKRLRRALSILRNDCDTDNDNVKWLIDFIKDDLGKILDAKASERRSAMMEGCGY